VANHLCVALPERYNEIADSSEVGLQRNERNGLIYYTFDLWAGLKHGVFTRHGGVSAEPWSSLNLGGNVGDSPENVRCNHERMYAALEVRGERACTVWQVHSADVIIANTPVRGRRWLAAADALITDCMDVPLSMRFADCVPLLFFDPVRGVIGIAHAGWRGTVQGVGSNTIRAMARAYDSRPEDIQVVIGPSIGAANYQVGEEVVKAIDMNFGSVDGLISRDARDGTAYLDLWAANRLDLERAGVQQIEVAGICTAERVDEFFSHRREKGRTGRFGAVISL
jgi:YfiH family protein